MRAYWRRTVLVAAGLAFGMPAAYGLYTGGAVGEKHVGLTKSNMVCNGTSPTEVIVGLWVKGGTYVDQLGIMCAPILRNGSLGTNRNGPKTPEGASVSFLPGVSSREKTVLCPANFELGGIKAHGAEYVDRINAIRCVRFYPTPVRGQEEIRYVDVGIGGSGGTVSRMYCTGGPKRAIQLVAYSGSWVDYLSVTCE